MDQALKSLIASEEEVVASLGLSRQWHLFSLTPRPSQLRVSGYCLSLAEGTGRGRGFQTQPAVTLSHHFALFFSPPPLPPLCHPTPPRPTVSPHCTLTLHPATRPCSKCGDLEEELKIVTNNLKSLEAQADKV